MTRQTPTQTPMSTKIGVGLMAAALLWWFLYYAHYEGAFGLMGLKLMCITGSTMECDSYREWIGKTVIPAYQPALWWAGVTVYAAGRISRRFFSDTRQD